MYVCRRGKLASEMGKKEGLDKRPVISRPGKKAQWSRLLDFFKKGGKIASLVLWTKILPQITQEEMCPRGKKKKKGPLYLFLH